jgi:hypothetical protein
VMSDLQFYINLLNYNKTKCNKKPLAELFTGESVGRKKNGLPKHSHTRTALTQPLPLMGGKRYVLNFIMTERHRNTTPEVFRCIISRVFNCYFRMSFRTCFAKKPYQNNWQGYSLLQFGIALKLNEKLYSYLIILNLKLKGFFV